MPSANSAYAAIRGTASASWVKKNVKDMVDQPQPKSSPGHLSATYEVVNCQPEKPFCDCIVNPWAPATAQCFPADHVSGAADSPVSRLIESRLAFSAARV